MMIIIIIIYGGGGGEDDLWSGLKIVSCLIKVLSLPVQALIVE